MTQIKFPRLNNNEEQVDDPEKYVYKEIDYQTCTYQIELCNYLLSSPQFKDFDFNFFLKMLYGYQGLMKNSIFNKGKKNINFNKVKMNLQELFNIYEAEK